MNGDNRASTSIYQRWSHSGDSGQHVSRRPALKSRTTWLAITTTGVGLAYKRSGVALLLVMSFGFVIGTCIVLYVLSLLETLAGTPQARGMYDFVQTFLQVDISGVGQIADYRELLWRSAFILVMKVQLFWVMFVIARVGPGLIADDLKAHALPIYFARPIAPATYLLGKGAVAAVFIGLVTLVPNLVSLTLGTAITGGLQSWGQTLRLGLDLTLCGAAVIVIGSGLILLLSSLTSDKRYVAFGWMAVCLLPNAAQVILRENLPHDKLTGFLGSVSINGNFNALTEWLFSMRSGWQATPLPSQAFEQALGVGIDPLYPAVVLTGVTLLALFVCHRRVIRFSRSAANV